MLKNISTLKGAQKLDKNTQKAINGGKGRFCGGTGGIPIGWPQSECYGWGIQWYNGQCYACY